MAKIQLKSFQQILASMAAKLSAETPITDFSDGSVSLTLLEMAAQEDFQQYVQMLNIIRNYNLDTTEGADLDKRAAEIGLTRLQALPHSGFVTITDTSFTKISTKIYAGLPGPISGGTSIFVDDASAFTAAGSVYVGRGTVNSEGPIAYSSAPINLGAYWEIQLDTALLNDHGTDESVILAQGGTRVIEAGTEVEIPESDISERVVFEENQTVELLDGEDEIDNVLVTALEPGGFSVPANSIVSFSSSPFVGAEVTNPLPFVNGRDEESDQQLRDRIRSTIQSLSRGTAIAVRDGITGLLDSDTNSRITSVKVVTPVNLADGPTKVFINNGRGLEPELDVVGLETVITTATGGESFFQLQNFPVVKASLISQNIEPFSLFGNETFIVRVGTNEESFTFASSDFSIPGRVKASEVVEAINNKSVLIEARTITDTLGKHVFIIPKARNNEELQFDSASSSQSSLNFSELEVSTLKLYKNDLLLTKDGLTASLISLSEPFNISASTVTTTDGDITVSAGSKIVSKIVAGLDPFLQKVHPGDYIKFSSDSDLFYTKVKTVVSDTKFLLESAYPATGGGLGNITIWNSPQLEVAANGDLVETEIVSFGPNDFANPTQASAEEVIVRLDSELQLSKVELAVNNTRIRLISEIENSDQSKMRVTGGGVALSMGYSTQTSLNGTLTFNGGSKTVTGSGTLFTSELKEGEWIKADSHNTGSWTKVESIESDTVLYLTEGYRGLNEVAVSSSKINFSEESVGKNKDYTLNRSNGQIELASPLVAGDNLTAGSINTRAFVDSLQETFDFDSIGASSQLIVCVDGGLNGTVTTGDGSAPYDTFIDTSLIGYSPNLFNGFYIEWISGSNIGETSYVSSYNSTTGQIVCTTGFTNAIIVGDKYILCQVIDFIHASDFVDPENATAAEVLAVINSQLLGAAAEELENGRVRIRTSNHTDGSKIQIKGGSANNVLAYSLVEAVNQLSNTAFLQTQNSDRNGNPLAEGFTLGPDQNLVAILDNDSLNKTFSIILQVEGTVTSTGIGTFTDTTLGGKYTTPDYFNDFWIYWISGANEGSVQLVTDYSGLTGTITYDDVFPSSLLFPISSGDEFALVPRTAENVVKVLNDFNITTLSVVATSEVVGISGDFVQVSSKEEGSTGKVFIAGGTSNRIGIAIESVPAGAPLNDVTTSSRAGLSKGLLVNLTIDGTVTTGDGSAPYDTFIDTSLISGSMNYFTGMDIEFLSGNNIGFKTSIASYNNLTGQIVLTDALSDSILIGDSFRISLSTYVVDIVGSTAPYTISFNDASNSPIDVSEFTTSRSATIRDVNGLNFSNIQVEGVDGYKYYTGLIQKAQWTIDGLDRDQITYPGVGASGTQFEVLPPVLVKVRLIVDITTEEGVSLSSVSDSIKTAISEYINSRDVGEDVILSEIIASAQSVDGVFDVTISNHSSNIIIADGEQAYIVNEDLIIG